MLSASEPPRGGVSSEYQSCLTFETSHGSGSDEGSADDQPRGPEQLSPSPDEPGDGGESDDEHLGRRPPAESERETEQQQLAPARPLLEAKRQEDDGQAEDERRAVEAMRPRRLPDDVRGPDPEGACAETGVWFADRSDSNPPRQQGADREQHQRHGPEGLDARSGQREHPGCQELFVRPPIRLTPVESTELAIQDVARHHSRHRFVGVESSDGRAENPGSQDDPCCCEADDHRSDADSTHGGSYEGPGLDCIGAGR